MPAVNSDEAPQFVAKETAATSPPPDTSWVRLGVMMLGWSFCTVTWCIGVYFPSLQLHVLVGTPLHYTITKSLTQSLQTLFVHRMFTSFVLLTFFSIVIPLMKIVCTFWLIRLLCKKPLKAVFESHAVMIWTLTYLASYQFVDLYVGVLLAAFFNSDSSDSNVCIGFYFFFAYCLASCGLSSFLESTFSAAIADGGQNGQNQKDSLERDEQADPESQALQTLKAFNDVVVQTAQYVDCADPIKAMGAPQGRELSDLAKDPKSITPGSSFNLQAVVDAVAGPGSSRTSMQVDTTSVWFFSAGYLLLMALCVPETMLELRLLLKGVTIDRNALSPTEIIVYMLPEMLNPIMLYCLWFFLVVAPILYIVTLVMRSLWPDAPTAVQNILRAASDVLRQWAMMDVFAIASFICLCILQDKHSTMITPDGSCVYYLFLGGSFSLFFLRWFAEGDESGLRSYKPWVLISFWLMTCALLLHGVPGTVRHYHFQDLGAVCKHGQDVMNSVIGSMPHSFGDCSDKRAKPPQPCSGSTPLYKSGSVDSDEFTEAIWFGGLHTMHFNTCSLNREVLSTSRGGGSQFHLVVGGQFERIQLYLRAHDGPIVMDSPNHCCGQNITFNLKFVVDCAPGLAHGDGIKNVRMEKCDLAPLLVEEKHLGGSLTIDEMDLSSMVEKLVKQHIHSFVSKVRVTWGHKPTSIAQMLNKLVLYNAPRRAGQC